MLEPVTLVDFFIKIKKGSKNFRVVLDSLSNGLLKIDQLRSVKTYCKLTDSQFGNNTRIRNTWKSWNTFSFPNRFKVFLFKFYKNTLGTGNRLVHFVQNSEYVCIFCANNLILPPPIETFTHVFFDCPVVNDVISKYYNKYFVTDLDREQFFNGHFSGKESENLGCNLVLDALRYTIWQFRLLKSRLSFFSVELQTNECINELINANKKMKVYIQQNNFLCIDGQAERERGGGRPLHGHPNGDGAPRRP